MKAAFLLAILVFPACVSSKTQDIYRGEFCEVTVPEGWSTEMARGIAFAGDAAVPHVASKLSLPSGPVSVYLLAPRFLDDNEVKAKFVSPPPRVLLGSSCLENADQLPSVIAHELVHKCMTEAGWSTVPFVVQEVTAEFIARQLRGLSEEQILSDAIPTTRAEMSQLFELNNEDVQVLSQEKKDRMYRTCLGFLRSVGWPALLSMLHEGRASREELLAAFEAGTQG